ncbi:MAG: glycerophosphodiester phosphodiesterase [Desulfovibrio sp.]|nr:glycerophosphodiester phosphodiesterase [Desulfovibrio sp.]
MDPFLLRPFGPICAHRGGSSLAPENTLLAARYAMALGAHCWELDVQLSADGELLVIHDDTLARTTDVAARPEFAARAPWLVHEFLAEEVRTLSAGAWFLESAPHRDMEHQTDREEIAAQRVPTLREALALTRAHRFPMNLEIKDHAGQPGDGLVVARVLDLLAEAQCDGLVLLSSFRHEYLAQARALCPSLPTAALVEDRHPDNLIDFLRRLGVMAYHPEYTMVDAALVHELHAAGLRVHVWTVNERAHARALLGMGVDALITDWPQRLANLAPVVA